jgi:mono/diheme cytochrome c family protein
MHARTKFGRAALCAVALTGLAATPALGDGPGLAVMMERMQTYTHKLQLSLAANNARLADLYLHELEEAAEYVVDNLPYYHDFPVGQLTREMLLPSIEALEDTLDEADWAESGAGFARLLDSCNACHAATGKGYIRIAPAAGNPFAQDFSVIED